jgi:hypothetical protein
VFTLERGISSKNQSIEWHLDTFISHEQHHSFKEILIIHKVV